MSISVKPERSPERLVIDQSPGPGRAISSHPESSVIAQRTAAKKARVGSADAAMTASALDFIKNPHADSTPTPSAALQSFVSQVTDLRVIVQVDPALLAQTLWLIRHS